MTLNDTLYRDWNEFTKALVEASTGEREAVLATLETEIAKTKAEMRDMQKRWKALAISLGKIEGKEERNGVSAPSPNTRAGRVWGICEELKAAGEKDPNVFRVMELYNQRYGQDSTPATLTAARARWLAFYMPNATPDSE